MTIETATSVLRDIWREQVHVDPRLLELLPPAVAARLPHILAPADILIGELRLFPLGLLRLWRDSGRGHVLITNDLSGYRPGPQRWRRPQRGPTAAVEADGVGLCLLRAADLLAQPPAPPLPVLAFWDHLLGSGAEVDGGWFSQGKGLHPLLAEAAARFATLEALRYGHDALGAADAGDYLGRTMWLYAHDRQRLTVLDPPLARFYTLTLFSPAFWRRLGARP